MTGTAVQPTSLSPEETIRVALLVEYCGESFKGSQFQPSQPTVQQALQDALRGLGLTTSAVSFASRTDAGVHARGQVAHVDIQPDELQNVPNLAYALNTLLSDSVSVQAVQPDVGHTFHSRRDAQAKWYRYRIYNGAHRSAWAQRTGAVHVHDTLDADRMQAAARLLMGTHNFRSFKGADTAVTDDVCHLHHVQVQRDGDYIHVDVVGNRFLYKMIRNLVGQLIALGKSPRTDAPERILDILAQQNRQSAAATAPAHGLTLMAIAYPQPVHFFARQPLPQHLETLLKTYKMESLQNENLFSKAS